MKRRDLRKMIEKDGWIYRYSTGGHDQYEHPKKPGKVTLCGHDSDEVQPKTLKSVLKQAGLR